MLRQFKEMSSISFPCAGRQVDDKDQFFLSEHRQLCSNTGGS